MNKIKYYNPNTGQEIAHKEAIKFAWEHGVMKTSEKIIFYDAIEIYPNDKRLAELEMKEKLKNKD